MKGRGRKTSHAIHLDELERSIFELLLSINHPELISKREDVIIQLSNGANNNHAQNNSSSNHISVNGTTPISPCRSQDPRYDIIGHKLRAMVERLRHILTNPPEDEQTRQIDPEYVCGAFQAVINERGEKSLRKPISFERLWEVFQNAENEPHTLEELTANLPATQHPNRDLASLISRLNKAFERVGYGDIMIKHVTAYQIVERPPAQPGNTLTEPIQHPNPISSPDIP